MAAARENGRSRPRPRAIVVTLVALGALTLSACSSTSNDEYEKQISDLESQLADSQAQLEATQSELDSTKAELDSTQAELDSTTKELASTQAELETAQAELLDAQAQLAKVGELVLEDGTYTGQVLAAKATPYRVILFDAAGLWRVAQVADDAAITSGGEDLTLQQLGKLLQSTNPDDIKLVNGDYKVTVKKGLVTSLRKSKS